MERRAVRWLSALKVAAFSVLLIACRNTAHADPASTGGSAQTSQVAHVAQTAQTQTARDASPVVNVRENRAEDPKDASRDSWAPEKKYVAHVAHVATDWCMQGLSVLDESTCYVLPDGARPTTLLIYLHGLVPPVPFSGQKESVEFAVRDASRRAGVAALLPRGIRGIGPENARDDWAWPTTSRDYAKYAPGMIDQWNRDRAALEQIAGSTFSRVYLAGSSNGAYFLSALAFHHAVDVDGFAAISGGSAFGWTPARLGHDHAKPFYVGYGKWDITKEDPRSLAALLNGAGWPLLVQEHPVSHGARPEYLDEAFAFFASQAAPQVESQTHP